LDDLIIENTFNASGQLNLIIKPYTTDADYLQLEQTIFEQVALAAERPEIALKYHDAKDAKELRRLEDLRSRQQQKSTEEEKQKDKEKLQREKEMAERMKSVAEKLKGTLVDYESSAMYSLAVLASKGLDYEIPKERIKNRVEHLFNPDDNLLDRPLFGNGEKGTWARFVKEVLGDGFYSKLHNLESDMDEFYIAVWENVQKKVTDESQLTEEQYESAICETFNLKDVLSLLERERDIYITLLKRFQEILVRDPVDYTKVLDDMKKRLMPTGEFFTSRINEPNRFEYDYSTKNDREAFNAIRGKLTQDFASYLQKNASMVAVVGDSFGNSIRNNMAVILLKDSGDGKLKAGSCGTIREDGYNYDTYVTFSYVIGSPEMRNVKLKLKEYTLAVAQTVEEKYGNFSNAADFIVSKACQKSIEVVKDNYLVKRQEIIRSFHPYLDEQLKFRERFYELMVERFKGMYEMHMRGEQKVEGKQDTPVEA
jgi:hypothetical protein